MQSMYSVVNIRESIEDVETIYHDDSVLHNVLSRFSCPKNSDVEAFLRNNSIEFTKKSQSGRSIGDGPCRELVAWGTVLGVQKVQLIAKIRCKLVQVIKIFRRSIEVSFDCGRVFTLPQSSC